MSQGARRVGRGLARRVRGLVPTRLADAGRFFVFHVPPVAAAAVPGVTAVSLGPADLPRVAACRAMADPDEGARRLARRFEAGATAFGLEEDGVLVGYCWGRVGGYVAEDVDRYRMDLAPHDAYVFDAWLRPAARRRRLFELLVAITQRGLAALGARRFVSTVATGNAVSLAVHARIGATRLETVAYARLAGLTVHASRSPAGTRAQFGDRDFVSRAARDPEAP